MKVFAETERLILREILPSDVSGMMELDSDPEVHKYLGNKPVKSTDEIKKVIEFVRQQYVDNGIGRWAIIEKSTNNFIGWTGLKLVRETINNHNNYYDLGYRLIRKYWGQGFATESALASVNYAFNQLHLNTVFAAAHVDNNASNHVLSKLKFEKVESFDYDNAKHYWYRLQKSVWSK